ncbi:oxygen-dependent coproporphyrinogen oxidase [Fretibacter rubidus]|uniref:oxygen-dependent coproporphyrinogen oxidase n=1 Tax=Fretibacter rubidus TaxID=570162 RepID=UPI00352A9A7F
MTDPYADKKTRASTWFKTLRDDICAEFEAVERDAPDALYPGEPGKFVFEDWKRKQEDGNALDLGGGTGGMLRGRVFEKCGVHISVVKGEFTPEMQARQPGADKDPRFWAAGISLIGHMKNPHMPCVHMNTRYIVTTQDWFGGGGDLTPTQAKDRDPNSPDAQHFHSVYKDACEAHGRDYEAYKKWCDEYFHLHHRDEPRGIGGIFYDRVNTGDWEADFAFTQDVGRAFLSAYPPIARQRMHQPWTDADREEQLIQRGRYVEFNLLYDRGTTFGLKTGGNVKTILSSMPPVVRWP